MTIGVVIADDHPIVLQGLKTLFELEDDIDVQAQCLDGPTALDAVRTHRPSVLLLDLAMEEQATGLDVLRQLQDETDPPNVVLLTAQLNEDELLETVRLGARGVLLKEMAPQMLVQCVRKVAAGGEWLEKDATAKALQKLMERQETAEKLNRLLTARQIDIIKLVAAGLSNKAVADKLHITEGTVKVHLHTIYEKLEISGRHELARFAQEHGLG